MIVVDASAWVTALVLTGDEGEPARRVLGADDDWAAPSHAAVEVLRTIRRWERTGRLGSAVATALVSEVIGTEVRYVPPNPDLLAWIWRARKRVSMYDAHYVHLAGELDVPLVTMDRGLARAAASLDVKAVVPGGQS